jgi:hypothetical protein
VNVKKAKKSSKNIIIINTEIPIISKKEKHDASFTSKHEKKGNSTTLKEPHKGNDLGRY